MGRNNLHQGTRLKELVDARGVSVISVAGMIERQREYVYDLFKKSYINSQLLDVICRKLGVPVNYFFAEGHYKGYLEGDDRDHSASQIKFYGSYSDFQEGREAPPSEFYRNFAGAEVAVRIQGNNMSPLLDNGDVVLITPVEKENAKWTDPHFIITNGFTGVRYLNVKSTDLSIFTLTSANTVYPPLEVNVEQIRSIYAIRVVIRQLTY